jgi:oligosaccharide repeat unit polymerase
MSIIGFISFTIAGLVVLFSISKRADILSPARVFAFIWSIAVGLTELKLSALQHEWTIMSWVLVLLGPCSFLLGTFVPYVHNLRSMVVPLDVIRQEVRKQPIDQRFLFRLICGAFVLYCGSYLTIYLVKGFLPVLSVGARSRAEFTVFGAGLFLYCMSLIIFFSFLYHITTAGEGRRKLLLKFICLFSAATYFFALQRYQYILTAVMCFVLVYYTTRRINLRSGILFCTLIGGFAYWLSSIRTGQVIQYILYESSKMKFAKEFAIFTEPYMYVVMNLENFARAVDRLDSFTLGYYTFDFMGSVTGLKHWMSDYFTLDPMPFLNSGYNTYTAFWTFYRDFGSIGLLLFPFLLGWGIGSLYYAMRKLPSLIRVSSYSIALFVLVISFFNAPFANLWFVFIVVATYVILRVVSSSQRSGVPQTSPAMS